MGEEFLARVDGAEDGAPDLLGGLHLARDLVGPIVRHVAVRAGRAHARAVGEVHRAGQLLIDVVAHLVATDAEAFGVGEPQRGVESAPENHAAAKSAEGEEYQDTVEGGPAEERKGTVEGKRGE